MSDSTDSVDRLMATWGSCDIEAIMDCFSEDAVYTNMPMDPPSVGSDMIRGTISGFLAMAEGIEFVVHHQGESADGVVFNERTDRFKIGGKWVEAHVMGVFEVEGGKIKAWRDYFDLAQFQTSLSG